MAMLSSLTGGGGISGGDSQATGGTAGATSGTGAKNLTFGGNPNVRAFLTPQVMLALVGVAAIAAFVWSRRGK